MPRTTTILALLQTMLVIFGFFGLGMVLKLQGYPEALGVRWNPLAVLLREHGLWLLVFPVLWGLFALRAGRPGGSAVLYRAAVVAGVGVAGLLIVAFFYAAAFSYTVPFVLGHWR